MNALAAGALGGLWGGSELWLALRRRSGTAARSQDQASLRLIWIAVSVAIALGVAASRHLSGWRLPAPGLVFPAAWVCFFAGTALRWYSIHLLGKFFTVDVAIAEDHRLIETGPYRIIRHPSYTGVLLAALGFALSLSNLLSVFIIVAACAAALGWRIRIEEAALLEGLGETYAAYRRRTWRLVPGVF